MTAPASQVRHGTSKKAEPRIAASFSNKPPKDAAQIMAELIFSRLNRTPELQVVKGKVA